MERLELGKIPELGLKKFGKIGTKTNFLNFLLEGVSWKGWNLEEFRGGELENYSVFLLEKLGFRKIDGSSS